MWSDKEGAAASSLLCVKDTGATSGEAHLARNRGLLPTAMWGGLWEVDVQAGVKHPCLHPERSPLQGTWTRTTQACYGAPEFLSHKNCDIIVSVIQNHSA